MKPKVYDHKNNLLGVLENATQIGYRKKFNDLWTASFKLPSTDPKCETLCQMMNVVEIFDGETSIGKFRIIGSSKSSLTDYSSMIEFNCEHVIAFLMGDYIYSAYGQSNLKVGQVINNLLTIMQTPYDDQNNRRWVFDADHSDFTSNADKKYYNFTEVNVLDAVFTVPKSITTGEWHFEYDLSSWPWKLSIKKLDTSIGCEIRRGRNLVDISREIDTTKLCNKLYVFGENGGSIASVNDNKEYIIDQDSIDQYGVATNLTRLSCLGNSQSLKDAGQQVLDVYCQPIISYEAEAVDLWKETGREYDRFDEGKVVRIVDPVVNVDIAARIIEVYKPDIDGDPLRVELTISNIGNRYWSLYER